MWKWIFLGITGLGVMAIRRRIAGAVCRSKALMVGKTVVITGANSGIGKATAVELARRKARVILACRDEESAEEVAGEIRSKCQAASVEVMKLDLASFDSIRQFAHDLINSEDTIDVLINNAGVYCCPYSLTEDGLERQMGVNYIGHFLLTNILLDKIIKASPSRIIVVSSALSKYGSIDDVDKLMMTESTYDAKKGYQNSKLAENYFVRELSRRLHQIPVKVCCVRPGMARTNLGRHVQPHWLIRALLWPLAWLLTKTPDEACQTVVHCAIAPEVLREVGHFYSDCKEDEWECASTNSDLAKRLWLRSEEIAQSSWMHPI